MVIPNWRKDPLPVFLTGSEKMERKTIKVVAAVIRKGDKIFATQRGYGNYKDWWEFPGGKTEPGETSEEALIREIREELRTKIAVDQFLTTVEYDYPEFHLSMDCFWCHIEEGELTLLEHEAARWLPLHDLRQVNWLPADVLVVEAIEGTVLSERGDRMDRQTVFDYISKKYKTLPEYPWRRYDENAVFRHADNKKWFALVMGLQADKIGGRGDAWIDVVNLKIDDMFFRDMILQEEGILPAYHMNKMHWITVLLDGTVPEERVFELIDMSFLATASAKKKEKLRPPKEWIIPSNPKYYDIVHAFDDTDIIDWKQGAGIRKGDTVFLYVGAPVSAVLYKCRVMETGIPYQYQDRNLTITALMKIRLQKRYAPDRFTFDVLKAEYGIYAVRGPRGIPGSLSDALNNSER